MSAAALLRPIAIRRCQPGGRYREDGGPRHGQRREPRPPVPAPNQSMIPKSGYRFSDKIMLHE